MNGALLLLYALPVGIIPGKLHQEKQEAFGLTGGESWVRVAEKNFVFVQGQTMKINVVIERDEAGYFVAEVPAFPGCVSQGNTREEALANIKEAIQVWLEVMEEKHPFNRTEAIEVVI